MHSLISVVIVSYNTRDLVAECLRSLTTDDRQLLTANATVSPHQPPITETIVVDNGSTDGSADMVARDFPEATLICNQHNAGFARANNQGIALSSGRYIALLNADTMVPACALAELVGFMDAHPQVGACSPRLVRTDGTPQPYAFGRDPTPGYLLRRGLKRALFRRPLHDWGVTDVIEVDWVSGACLIARREVIDQVGGLDENFFMYFEDNDWCLRMRKAGWKIYYNPQVSITHIGGQSIVKNPAARVAYYRSLAYFYDKHYGRAARGLLKMALSVYRLTSIAGR